MRPETKRFAADSFIYWKPFAAVRIYATDTSTGLRVMKHIVPLVCALVPLVAMVGACVSG